MSYEKDIFNGTYINVYRYAILKSEYDLRKEMESE